MSENYKYNGTLESEELFFNLLEFTFKKGINKDDIEIFKIRPLNTEEANKLSSYYNTAIEIKVKEESLKVSANKKLYHVFYCKRQYLTDIKGSGRLSINAIDINTNNINDSLISNLNEYGLNKTNFTKDELIITEIDSLVNYHISIIDDVNTAAMGSINMNILELPTAGAYLTKDKTSIVANGTDSVTFTYTINVDSKPALNQKVEFKCTVGKLTPTVELGEGKYKTTLTSTTVESTELLGTSTVSVDKINNKKPLIAHSLKQSLERTYVSIETTNATILLDSDVLEHLSKGESISYTSANAKWLKSITFPANATKNKAIKLIITATWATTAIINSVSNDLSAGTYIYVFDGTKWNQK